MKHLPNRIQYLDGTRFMRVLQAATHRLVEKHGHLNDINVFPVPDGDTGSNMAGTMRNIVTRSTQSVERSIGKMSDIIAESALMSARGNSGVILAQFLCGFSEGVKGLRRVTPNDFVNAATTAARRAREAISDPKDGTILTVINDWATHLRDNRHRYQNFHELLNDSLEQAKQSVRSTTMRLASLKKADVVDAGGLGFVYLLEGIVEFTERGSLKGWPADALNNTALLHESVSANRVQDRVQVDSLEFLYCTECLICRETPEHGTDAALSLDASGTVHDAAQENSTAALRAELSAMGDSLIVAGTGDRVRVHVHTNEPEQVFAIAERYGTVTCRKAENMLEQHRRLLDEPYQRTGILTDSTCDLPETLLTKYDIRVVPLRLYLDDEEHIDGMTISPDAFNARLAESDSARTSQPAPSDVRAAYEGMREHFHEVAALHVMARYSGTLQSSANLAKTVWETPRTMDSGSLTGGLGLLVLQAAQRARAGMGAEEITRLAEEDKRNLHVFVSMDTLEFAVRGGRMSRGQGALARLLNIKPVLTFDPREEGKLSVVAKAFGPRRAEERLFALLHREVAGTTTPPLFTVTHVAAPATAERYAQRIEREFGVAPLFILPASPVLGCHSGPGACAVSMLLPTESAPSAPAEADSIDMLPETTTPQ